VDYVTGEWSKLHSEELHILYSSTNIIRQIKSWRMWWAGIGEERKVYKALVRKVYKVLVGKSMEKCQIGSPRHR
jgi:hypothetical protein